MKAKFDVGNYEWVMFKHKGDKNTDGRTLLFIPKGSVVTLNHLRNFSNLAVEKFSNEGVWLLIR